MGNNKKKLKKVFLLFVVIFITAVVLVVETYAWFVGITTVNVDEFTINVTSDTGLEISMDGEHWFKDDKPLIVNANTIAGTSTVADELTSNAYSGNTNSWVDANGLVPISSSGIMDTSVGRLNFFEKSSLSSTSGGYRIIADPINHSSGEAKSYVVFDVFIRNGTDNIYANSNYDDNAAENVYLKYTSQASVNGSTDYGAANSVRVGFFLLAGMKSYGATTSDIRGLSCSTTTSGVKRALCPSSGASQGLYWNIWEPNHTSHTVAVSSYFNNICKNRNANGTYTTTSCSALSSSTATYPIYDQITANNDVDIYDGLNGHTSHIYSSSNTSGKLSNLTTYKTPGSSANYTESSQLFKLAGNSITRVRVYIWLEGQDPDNYDIISRNSNVSVNFGLTKDRYELKPQYVYLATDNHNYIGQAIQGRQYGSFYDARKAHGHPASIAFIISNGLISEAYTVFEKDGEFYYLRGGIDESSLTNKPIYEENKETIKEAFGPNWSTYCTEESTRFICSANNLYVGANTSGDAGAYGNDWSCHVSPVGGARCY